ncbi:hypothetical protein AB0C52_27115 [Streptomyces sp. NPDC048717]|uniref:hypothetical protein n=1 Tax=Streptomyces sp. NPDC048717 TaxID=3154928 RepID=UPI0034172930
MAGTTGLISVIGLIGPLGVTVLIVTTDPIGTTGLIDARGVSRRLGRPRSSTGPRRRGDRR